MGPPAPGHWPRDDSGGEGVVSDNDLDRELQTHLEIEAEEQGEGGLGAAAAADAARRALGSVARIKEDVRALSPRSIVDDFAQDIRYGVRMLRKHMAFAVAVVLTLALGVGATTAIFSVVDAVLLRPLPYPDADRLAMVWENVDLPAYKNTQNTPAPGNFGDWRAQNSTFVDLAAIRANAWTLTDGGEPTRLGGAMVSASLFTLLQVAPAIGRGFSAEEDRSGSARVVVLGHALWADRFGSDPSVVNRTIRLNDEPYTVIGVMPAGFRFPDSDSQFWTPLGLTSEQLANHGSHFLRVVGRLKPGVAIDAAQGDLDAIAKRLMAQYPNSNTGVGVSIVPLPQQVVGDVRRPLLVMAGVVGLLLLMVCANVGNLLLARASSRKHEFALRAALGASRLRMTRQLLAESLLLASIGGLLGLGLAAWGVGVLRLLAPAELPRIDEIAINGPVAVFNMAVTLAAGLLCGMLPAIQSGRRNLTTALVEQAYASAGRARLRVRHLLVIAQTALGVVVLVCAGLLLRSFVHLTEVPVGFGSEGVLTLRVALPNARYRTGVEREAFYRRLADKLEVLPGATSAGAISFLPLTMSGRTTGVSVEGETPQTPGQIRFVDFRSVSPGYFTSMSIPLLAGRNVAWSDTAATPLSIVISETMARTFWPGQNAIGKRIKLGRLTQDLPWISVVGIVGDVRQLELTRVPRPAMYLPALQDMGTGDTLRDWVVRTSGDPLSLASEARTAIWTIDPQLAIARIQTMEQILSASTAPQRFNLLLIGLFAGLGLLLAAIGLYGVTAHTVALRTRELGIRTALGAQRSELLRLVLGDGARLTIIGLGVGTFVAFFLSRLMATMLFGVSAHDATTFAGVGLLVIVVSIVASLIPARRAVRLDPTITLREA